MTFSDIVYFIVVFLFVFMTFGIIKNYYKSKFDDDGHRMDMHEEKGEEN